MHWRKGKLSCVLFYGTSRGFILFRSTCSKSQKFIGLFFSKFNPWVSLSVNFCNCGGRYFWSLIQKRMLVKMFGAPVPVTLSATAESIASRRRPAGRPAARGAVLIPTDALSRRRRPASPTTTPARDSRSDHRTRPTDARHWRRDAFWRQKLPWCERHPAGTRISPMDCCNYMQYRHPYYGSHFYDNGLYNGRDFYGHPYQGYYSNSQYYQQWSCVAPFPGTCLPYIA